VVGERLQRGGDAVEDPRGARHEASCVLEDEDLRRVLAQQREGGEQEGEGGDEVRVGHRTVESRELDAGEAPEGEVVGEGGEGALIQDMRGEGASGLKGQVGVAAVDEPPEGGVGLREREQAGSEDMGGRREEGKGRGVGRAGGERRASEAESRRKPGTAARSATPKVSAPVNALAHDQADAPARGEAASERMRCSTQRADRKCTPRPRARSATRGRESPRARQRGSVGGRP